MVLKEGQPTPILCGKSAPQRVLETCTQTHTRENILFYTRTQTQSQGRSAHEPTPMVCSNRALLCKAQQQEHKQTQGLPTVMLLTSFAFCKENNYFASNKQSAPPLYLKQPLLLLSFRCGPCWGERVNIATSFTTHNRPSPTAIIVINRGNKSILSHN